MGKTREVIQAVIADNSQGALNDGLCYSTVMLRAPQMTNDGFFFEYVFASFVSAKVLK